MALGLSPAPQALCLSLGPRSAPKKVSRYCLILGGAEAPGGGGWGQQLWPQSSWSPGLKETAHRVGQGTRACPGPASTTWGRGGLRSWTLTPTHLPLSQCNSHGYLCGRGPRHPHTLPACGLQGSLGSCVGHMAWSVWLAGQGDILRR